MAVCLIVLPSGGARAEDRTGEGDGEEKISLYQEKNASWMRNAAIDFLDSAIKPPITEWKLARINLPQYRKIPVDFDRYEISLLRSAHNGRKLTIAYHFYINDKLIKRLTATANVELFADVVVAKQKIKRGQTIDEGMVALEKRKITTPFSGLGTEIDLVIGQMAERNIRAGQKIRVSDTARPPDIKAEDIVMIVAENNNVKVTSRGVAKKDGSVGDVIPVVNLRSNKKIYAQIIDDSVVKVTF